MSYQPPQGYPQGYPQPPYAPPPKSSGGKIALAIIGGIVTICLACMVLGALGNKNRGRDGSSSGSSSAPPAPREYVTESCSQVAHMFGPQARLTDLQQNELWRQYDGKWVRWRVTVGDLSETFGRLQMQFRCGTESLLFDGHAAFGDDQRPALLRIQQGSSVNIEGRLSDHGRLLGLSLQDAEIRP